MFISLIILDKGDELSIAAAEGTEHEVMDSDVDGNYYNVM